MKELGVDLDLNTLSRFNVSKIAFLPGTISAIKYQLIDMNNIKNIAIFESLVTFRYICHTLGLLTTTTSQSCVVYALYFIFVTIITKAIHISSTNTSNVSNVVKFYLT